MSRCPLGLHWSGRAVRGYLLALLMVLTAGFMGYVVSWPVAFLLLLGFHDVGLALAACAAGLVLGLVAGGFWARSMLRW